MSRRILHRPTLDLAWGKGWIAEKVTVRGEMRFLARRREDGRVVSKTFHTRNEAEDWLLFYNPTGSKVTLKTRDENRFDTTVYFVQAVAGGLIKIGHASNPRRRLKDMQAGCPLPLRIIALVMGGAEREAYLHRKFAFLRVHGEWFMPDEMLLDWIAENATTLDERAVLD